MGLLTKLLLFVKICNMEEKNTNLARVLITDHSTEAGSWQDFAGGMGLLGGGLGGMAVGELVYRAETHTSTLPRQATENPEGLQQAYFIGGTSGAVLGATLVYASIWRYARNRLGKDEYKRIKKSN
jgi:hypothetical protein